MHVKYRRPEPTCEPLNTVQEVNDFMTNPPAWRVLCKELCPHSRELIRNIDINASDGPLQLEKPRAFCHFDPDAKEVPRRSVDELPRTLVCHDMANGYHDDRFVDGTTAYDAYTFYNWAGIDIFCYFSHHFVTVPPLGWIDAAHAHGVKVIGTIITEGEAGEKIWKDLLSSEEEVDRFIGSLVDIAKTLRFDGWLLNVENKIHLPERLARLVRALHGALHAALPHALLLWYDSVTVEGRLQWQDALNEKNKAFFDACDGIYTNYSWTEDHVARSVEAAGERVRDVYVGIDVWGRNFLGGGKFNLQQAVSIAHRHGCSLAIFAPAWTHEALDRKGGSEADKIERGNALEYYDRFLVRDRAVWDSLWPLLNTRLPSLLPFQTSFCRGQGKKRRMYGEVVSPGPWYNLRHMQYQPNAAHGPHGYLLSSKENIKNVSHSAAAHSTHDKPVSPHLRAALNDLINHRANRGSHHTSHDVKLRLAYVEEELDCLEVFFEDSFLGGSCLKINPCDAESPEQRWIRLFYTDFYCEEALVVCVVTKALRGGEGQALDVVLRGARGGEPVQVTLLSGARAGSGDPPPEREALLPLRPDCAQFRRVQRHLMLQQPPCYVPVRNHYGWLVRYYEVHMPGLAVRSVDVRARRPRGPALLGHLALCAAPTDRSGSTSPGALCVECGPRYVTCSRV